MNSTSSSSAPDTSASPVHHSNLAPAIAGGVVAAVTLIAFLGVLLFYLRRRKAQRDNEASREAPKSHWSSKGTIKVLPVTNQDTRKVPSELLSPSHPRDLEQLYPSAPPRDLQSSCRPSEPSTTDLKQLQRILASQTLLPESAPSVRPRELKAEALTSAVLVRGRLLTELEGSYTLNVLPTRSHQDVQEPSDSKEPLEWLECSGTLGSPPSLSQPVRCRSPSGGRNETLSNLDAEAWVLKYYGRLDETSDSPLEDIASPPGPNWEEPTASEYMNGDWNSSTRLRWLNSRSIEPQPPDQSNSLSSDEITSSKKTTGLSGHSSSQLTSELSKMANHRPETRRMMQQSEMSDLDSDSQPVHAEEGNCRLQHDRRTGRQDVYDSGRIGTGGEHDRSLAPDPKEVDLNDAVKRIALRKPTSSVPALASGERNSISSVVGRATVTAASAGSPGLSQSDAGGIAGAVVGGMGMAFGAGSLLYQRNQKKMQQRDIEMRETEWSMAQRQSVMEQRLSVIEQREDSLRSNTTTL